MSQYQEDYFFSESQRDDGYSMLHSPLIAQKNIYQYDFLYPRYDEKQQLPTCEINDLTELDPRVQIRFQKKESVLPKKQKRIKRNIQLSEEQKARRKEVFRGLKDDTTELNTNFKTVLLKKLKELSLLRELKNDDKELMNGFIKGVPSFAQIKKLCKSQNIKQKGLKFIKSTEIVQQLLNGNSCMEIKMTMLKYVQSLKQNFQKQNIVKWKDIYFQ